MARRNKYGARKTTVDGITFDSKAESIRYTELKLLERAGEISNLELQPRFELIPSFKRVDGKRIRGAIYTADFRYVDNSTGKTVIEDVKGVDTREGKLRRKLAEYHHNIVVLVVKVK